MSDEDFRIIYYDVGQGDCILVVCPNQKLVMIDCGSAKGLLDSERDGIAADIRNFTKNNNGRLDALILTHPDKDHYNQVLEFLHARSYKKGDEDMDLDTVTFSDVYFSETIQKKDYKPLMSYTVAAIGANIRGKLFKTKNLHHILINKDGQKCLTYSGTDDFKTAKEFAISNHRRTILKGTTPKNQQWAVSIIAGSVPGADNTNPLSLVTLLEIGKKKKTYTALFLGDATFETEEFLMDTHKDLISEVDFAHVPHHGSDTSSGPEFVKLVNPEGAQITMQTAESGFCLPKSVQTLRWIKQINKEEELHFFDYWEVAEDTKVNAEFAKWKKNPSYEPHIHTSGEHKNKYYLQIDKITPDFVGYYYLSHERMLFRGQTKKNIWLTGVSGLTEWYLPDSFF